jgi:hypothetical protein
MMSRMPERSDASRRPHAGKAFVASARSDLKSEAALRLSRARLSAFGQGTSLLAASQCPKEIFAPFAALKAAQEHVVRSIGRMLHGETATLKSELMETLSELGADYDAVKKDWELTYGAPYPETLEDFEYLAALAGFDGPFIREGRWTWAELEPPVRGCLKRLAGIKAEKEARDQASEAALPQTLANEIPRGTRWEEVSIVVHEGGHLQIQVGKKRLGPHDIGDLGLLDRRRRTRQLTSWGRLFMELARAGGRVDWSKSKSVERLREQLARAFGIKGQPAIEYYRRHGGGYETAFAIRYIHDVDADDGEQ